MTQKKETLVFRGRIPEAYCNDSYIYLEQLECLDVTKNTISTFRQAIKQFFIFCVKSLTQNVHTFLLNKAFFIDVFLSHFTFLFTTVLFM